MKIPDIIGKWRVVGILGRGLSGVVYKVVRVDDPTRVGALKICNASKGRPCKAFRREIGRMAEQPARGFMPRHFENGTHRGRPYFVMSLSRDLPEHLSRKEAVRTVLRIIDAAILLRDKGLWHCDYKRENVGIDENGEAVLRDYGSARTHEEANFNPAVVGTKFCRAPEVDYEGVCNEQTEVWSVGALFLDLLPFAARYTYALPILLAVHAVPFFRLRTFEELRRHIERAPQTERRRIWLGAGVWKTRIVAHKVSIATGAVVLVLTALFFGARGADSVRRENQYRERHAPKLSVDELVDKGYVAYRSGDMAKAREFLGMAIHSPGFSAKRYPYFDIKGFYEDACERTGR